VQDAARTQLRRKARRQEKAGISERQGRYSWKRKLYDAYDAGQAWIVVTLVGMNIRRTLLCADWRGIAIGLNAAFLNIATEWLSDIKLGYCTTAFYLNENFCCSGAESGMYKTGSFDVANVRRLSGIQAVDWLLAVQLHIIYYICRKTTGEA
jgi:chloride channel 3/4/5